MTVETHQAWPRIWCDITPVFHWQEWKWRLLNNHISPRHLQSYVFFMSFFFFLLIRKIIWSDYLIRRTPNIVCVCDLYVRCVYVTCAYVRCVYVRCVYVRCVYEVCGREACVCELCVCDACLRCVYMWCKCLWRVFMWRESKTCVIVTCVYVRCVYGSCVNWTQRWTPFTAVQSWASGLERLSTSPNWGCADQWLW